MHTKIGIILLTILAGLIPISIYFIEYPQTLDVNTASLPSRSLPLLDQQIQAVAGLVIKPIYMMLSLLIIVALIGQNHPSISALHWGQIAFLTGEIFCAINFYLYKHESILSEYLHSYGMALAFAFTSFAALEGWNMFFGSRSKLKVETEAWGWVRFIVAGLAILCLIPMRIAIEPEAYAVTIFQFPYSYTRLDVYQTYEQRILPMFALATFFVAYLLAWKRKSLFKIFLCAGIGALGFSLFRVVLNALFANNLVWFEFWEEALELIFVGAVAFILWQRKDDLFEQTPMLDLITKTSEAS